MAGQWKGHENELSRLPRDETQGKKESNATVTSIVALDGCKHLVPRACARIGAVSEAAYELPSESIQDLLLVLQQGDAFVKDKKQELNKARKTGSVILDT